MSANPGNVMGGHKAALHNPNVSKEAKENSRQALGEMEGMETAADRADAAKDPSHVVGGLKAAITNPNVSEEAKQRDREALQEMDVETSAPKSYSDKDPNRVIGGLKAAIANPNVSMEAKQHDRELLKEMEPHATSSSTGHKSSTSAVITEDGKDLNRQIAGLRGALKNPNNSTEAKEDIKGKLAELGATE